MTNKVKTIILILLIAIAIGIIRFELKLMPAKIPSSDPNVIILQNPKTPGKPLTIVLPKNFDARKAAYCIQQSLTIYDPRYMDFDSKVNLGKWCIEHYEELKYFTINN